MKGDYLTPDDPDSLTLDYLDVEELTFFDGEDETDYDLMGYPKIKSMFMKFVIGELSEYTDDVSKSVWKDMKGVGENRLYKFDEFVNEFPQFRQNRVKIYVDVENFDPIKDFLSAAQHAKKFRRILFEIFSLRYNDELYGKEDVSAKAAHITAMKFSQKDTVRIYCKEFLSTNNPKEKHIVMMLLYHKKVWKSKKLQELLEHIGGYEYDFTG